MMERTYWTASGMQDGRPFAKAFTDYDACERYISRKFEGGALVYLDPHSYWKGGGGSP